MSKTKLLTIYLYVFGIGNLITSIVFPVFFGDELLWQPRNLPTDLMVGSLYFAMGVIMLSIARNPAANKAFIDYIILGNLIHAVVMVVYAQQPTHIYIDALLIGSMGIIPLVLYPWPLNKLLRYG